MKRTRPRHKKRPHLLVQVASWDAESGEHRGSTVYQLTRDGQDKLLIDLQKSVCDAPPAPLRLFKGQEAQYIDQIKKLEKLAQRRLEYTAAVFRNNLPLRHKIRLLRLIPRIEKEAAEFFLSEEYEPVKPDQQDWRTESDVALEWLETRALEQSLELAEQAIVQLLAQHNYENRSASLDAQHSDAPDSVPRSPLFLRPSIQPNSPNQTA